MAGSPLNIIRPAYYCDTINGSVNPLSGLLDPSGQPISVGAACYVNNGDGSGNPAVWTCEVSTAAVDHSTVEAVANATGSRWLKSGAYGGGGGGGGGLPTGTRVTAASDQANLTFSGLTGAADGGYEIVFEWLAGTGGDTNLLLQLNGVTTGYNSGGIYTTATVVSDFPGGNPGLGTGVATTTGFDIARAGGAAGRDRSMGHIWLWPTTGGNILVVSHSVAFPTTPGALFESFDLRGIFPAATITQAVLVPSNASSTGIKQNSYGVIRKLGMTA